LLGGYYTVISICSVVRVSTVLRLGGSTGRTLAVMAIGLVLATALSAGPADAANARKAAKAAVNPVQTSRYGSIVVDADTGQVLYEDGADERKYPASLTKMMTLYLTFDALNQGKLRLDQQVPVSSHAQAQSPTKLGLRAGETIMVEQCILALVTKSANDCAVVLAETLGGTERGFGDIMTDKAHALGMSRTTFRNASGLPNDQQFSTPRDMATLSRALIRNHARYYHYFSRPSFTYKGVAHRNHNRLMGRYDGMDGLKTGFTNASGFNLAASAVRNGRRLVAVVFGGPSTHWRDNHLASLLNDAFDSRSGIAVASRSKAAPEPAAAHEDDDAEETAKVVRTMAAAQPAAPVKSAAVQKTSVKAAEPPKPVPAKAAAGSWGIQVGAYTNRKASERAVADASKTLSNLVSGAQPAYVTIGTKKGIVYRARLTGLDEKTAKTACARLSKSGQKCHTVSPGDRG